MTVSHVKDKKMDKRVLRFTASWCGPCKSLAKNLEEVNTSVPIEVIDIDVSSEVAIEYGVRGVPTLVMLEGNNEIKRLVGMQPLKALEDWLND
jgi:thioredoxin 1